MFLDSSPLSSIEGKILRTSYKPELTAENILAYKIHASLEDNIEPPRIGLRGSAKIYGDRTSLFIISSEFNQYQQTVFRNINDCTVYPTRFETQ